MSRRRFSQPPHRDDLIAAEHLRPATPDLATTDDVLGLDAASDDGADAHGLFDDPGSVLQFGENLLNAAGRGFSRFGENVVAAVGSAAKEIIDDGASGATAPTGSGDGNDDDGEGDEGEGGGSAEGGSSAQHDPSVGGIDPVDVHVDVDDPFTSGAHDSASAAEFESAEFESDELDLADELDDGFLAG